MNKIKFILLILIVLLSFIVAKALGQENKNSILVDGENNIDKSLMLASTEQIFENTQTNKNNSEIYAQDLISASSTSIINEKCNINLTAQLGLLRFLGQSYSLAEFKASNRWPLASITKLMTSVIAFENLNLEKNITITKNLSTIEGNINDFAIGEKFKAIDLIKAMLIFSSNRSAEALAQDFGRENFLNLMNQKAKELGMNDTNFFDPTGLSSKNQSTPNDIFKLVSYIYNTHSEILNITKQPKIYITELNSHQRRTLININEFAGATNFIGGKTGYTDEARGNLVSVFKLGNQPVIVIVMGSEDRFSETKKLLSCVNI